MLKKKVIPIPYQIILKKFLDESYEGKIEVGRARHILSFGMRMDKKKRGLILMEMKKCGWIKFESYKNILLKFGAGDLKCFY